MARLEVEAMKLPQTNLANHGVGPNTASSSSFPSWKLYDNPHYFLHSSCTVASRGHYQPPTSCLRMDHGEGAGAAELELCRARVKELRAELEFERRMRRKAESLNEVLAMELAEERRRSGAAEAECRRLQEEAEGRRAELERALDDVEEERRMLRVAELWREERVQMKLADAKAAMEEKLQEMARLSGDKSSSPTGKSTPTSFQSPRAAGQHRRDAGENPHIRRGIRGFVEFPRAIRVQSREERVDLESHLECQRAQLRVLMSHRNPPSGVGLMTTSENLVM